MLQLLVRSWMAPDEGFHTLDPDQASQMFCRSLHGKFCQTKMVQQRMTLQVPFSCNHGILQYHINLGVLAEQMI